MGRDGRKTSRKVEGLELVEKDRRQMPVRSSSTSENEKRVTYADGHSALVNYRRRPSRDQIHLNRCILGLDPFDKQRACRLVDLDVPIHLVDLSGVLHPVGSQKKYRQLRLDYSRESSRILFCRDDRVADQRDQVRRNAEFLRRNGVQLSDPPSHVPPQASTRATNEIPTNDKSTPHQRPTMDAVVAGAVVFCALVAQIAFHVS